MPKYGRGLNREIVSAVNKGEITEPFSVADVRRFTEQRRWHVPENYLTVCLANGANLNHSHTFKKYFESLGNGLYKVTSRYIGPHWR